MSHVMKALTIAAFVTVMLLGSGCESDQSMDATTRPDDASMGAISAREGCCQGKGGANCCGKCFENGAPKTSGN